MKGRRRTRKRGIRASREKLSRALAAAGLKTQAALAERIADLEQSTTPPRDLVSRAFRELPVDSLSLERVAVALGVEAHTLYLTSKDPAPPAVTQPTAKAIAVLPFLNLSRDDSTDYFCDGLTEELLNGLARVPGLRVAGHTSSFSFKKTTEDPATIASRLGVDHIVEGSVRVAGQRARITAQLVNPDDGLTLWSQRYDRSLGDVLTVQDEICQAVIDALQVALLGEHDRGTREPASGHEAAVNAWLQGRFFWNKRTDAGALKAIKHYEHAIRVDPEFALPHVGLADACRLLSLSGAWPTHEGYRRAKKAASRALELNSELAEAYRSLALIGMEFDWDWAAVAQNCARARELGAGKADIHSCCAGYFETQGRLDDAIEEREQASLLEPLWAPVAAGHALTLSVAGRYADATAAFERLFELDPAYPAHYGYGSLYYYQGRYRKALDEFNLDPRDGLRLTGAAMAHGKLGHGRKAASALRALIDGFSHVAPAQIAQVYVQAGDWKNAFAWLDRGCKHRDPGVVEITFSPYFAPLRRHRRFAHYLEQIGIEATNNYRRLRS
ncbi:MAG: hypothetical protein AAFN78_10570 [Pseudomonadota bacterium]